MTRARWAAALTLVAAMTMACGRSPARDDGDAPRLEGGSGSAHVTYRPNVHVVERAQGLSSLLSVSSDGSTLVISKVGNFSIDLPEAAVAIQVSGTFGSRQEEAQRLGRILRPKADGRQAHFYTVVSRDTIDTEYAAHRQRFLAEQGYAYTIVDADDVLGPALPT